MTTLALRHLYYGNIYDSRGQGIIAASEKMAGWMKWLNANAGFGSFEQAASFWRNADHYESCGLFTIPASTNAPLPNFVFARLFKSEQGDSRGAYVCHWALLSVEDVRGLDGVWMHLYDGMVANFNMLQAKIRQPARGDHHEIDLLTVQTPDTLVMNTVSEWFPREALKESAAPLLTLALGAQGSIIRGLPPDYRLGLCQALGGVLPPTLRGLLSFSTRLLQLNHGTSQIRFADDHQQTFGQADNEIIFDIRSGRWQGLNKAPVHPGVAWLINVVHQASPGDTAAALAELDNECLRLLEKQLSVTEILDRFSRRYDLEQRVQRLNGERDARALIQLIATHLKGDNWFGSARPVWLNHLFDLICKYGQFETDARDTEVFLVDRAERTQIAGALRLQTGSAWLNALRLVIRWLGSATADQTWLNQVFWELLHSHIWENETNQTISTAVTLIKTTAVSGTAAHWAQLMRTFAAVPAVLWSAESAVIVLFLGVRSLSVNTINEIAFEVRPPWTQALPQNVQSLFISTDAGDVSQIAAALLPLNRDEERSVLFKLAALMTKRRQFSTLDNHNTLQSVFTLLKDSSPDAIPDWEKLLNQDVLRAVEASSGAWRLIGRWIRDPQAWSPSSLYILIIWGMANYDSTSFAGPLEDLLRRLIEKGESGTTILNLLHDRQVSVQNKARAYDMLRRITPASEHFALAQTVLTPLAADEYAGVRQAVIIFVERLVQMSPLTHTHPIIASRLPARALYFFVREQNQPVIDALMTWWATQLTAFISDMQTQDFAYLWLKTASDAIGDRPLLRQAFIDSYLPTLRTQETQLLERFSRQTKQDSLSLEYAAVEALINLRILIPHGDLEAFYRSVVEADKFISALLFVQTQLDDDKHSQARLEALGTAIRYEGRTRLTDAERKRLFDVLNSFSDVVEKLSQRQVKRKGILGIGRKETDSSLELLDQLTTMLVSPPSPSANNPIRRGGRGGKGP